MQIMQQEFFNGFIFRHGQGKFAFRLGESPSDLDDRAAQGI